MIICQELMKCFPGSDLTILEECMLKDTHLWKGQLTLLIYIYVLIIKSVRVVKDNRISFDKCSKICILIVGSNVLYHAFQMYPSINVKSRCCSCKFD